MTDPGATSTIRCGEPMHIPSPHCTLPRGHDGRHQTTEIPEPLAGPVAEALLKHDEADELIRETRLEQLHWERQKRWLLGALYVISAVLVVHVVTDLVYVFSAATANVP